MDAILLAAGYGTRLYPLTKDRPKPLLPVGGRLIIDYVADSLEGCPDIDRLLVVTNARFAGHFGRWAAGRAGHVSLRLFNDGSMSNQERLGAVADIQFVLERAGPPADGVYVAGTDNLPRFDICDLIPHAQARAASAVFTCPATSPAELKRKGVAEVAPDGRIVSFEEKPDEPKGRFRVPPFYVYSRPDAAAIKKYLDEGGNPDAPGHFLSWLVARRDVYGLRREEGTYDVGTLDGYRAVCQAFERKRQSDRAEARRCSALDPPGAV
ncbi:MAG: nucleotidyltransferase family protein [Planctomycetota bacterium]